MAGQAEFTSRQRRSLAEDGYLLFNSASLWHSGTLNYSPGLRLAVTTYLSGPAKGRRPDVQALPRPRDRDSISAQRTPVAKGHVPIWFSVQGW